jgi:glucose-6-phosphate 1-epimerase
MKPERQQTFEIPGRVMFMDGNGELPKIEVATPWSRLELYLQGAHVTDFQKNDEAPILFLSQCSRFQEDQPIRGGVPIVFPWFGPREGAQMHGFARNRAWEIKEIVQLPEGGVTIRLCLPECPESALLPRFTAEYLVTVKDTLTMELIVANTSPDQDFTFENCFHTYFSVGDINAVSITGLKGAAYVDKVDNYARKAESAGHLKISQEVDRVYFDAPGPVEIHDSNLKRRICIHKSGSLSTVVWNPWQAKSAQMPDFADDEYLRMLCVESGNVMDNRLTLPAGKSSSLKVEIQTEAL